MYKFDLHRGKIDILQVINIKSIINKPKASSFTFKILDRLNFH